MFIHGRLGNAAPTDVLALKHNTGAAELLETEGPDVRRLRRQVANRLLCDQDRC